MKVWYRSKTIWLLASQLLIIIGSLFSGDIQVTAAIGLSCTTIAGFINRYYTDTPIKEKK